MGAWCCFSPNSQLLATGDGAGHLRLWEVLTGQEVYHFEGHRTWAMANFSPDGRLLVAASEDAPCFIWNVAGGMQGLKTVGSVDLEQMWRDLASADAKKAFLAMRQLAATPGPAVELLRKNLKTGPAIDGPKTDNLIRDLDSATFTIREAAMADLTKIADLIEPMLTKARGTAPLEARTRLDRLLEKAAIPSPERLRQSRALGTLEWIATHPAAKLLADLAARGNLDSLTVSAAEASERLRGLGVR